MDEALIGAEIFMLHATPIYYGLGVARGDGSGSSSFPVFSAPISTLWSFTPGSAALGTGLIFWHRHQCGMPEPADPAPPEPDHRQSAG